MWALTSAGVPCDGNCQPTLFCTRGFYAKVVPANYVGPKACFDAVCYTMNSADVTCFQTSDSRNLCCCA